MGTMIDYAYRFEGGGGELAQARATIEAHQAKMAKASGNGDSDFLAAPVIGEDGAMTWSCYSTRGVDGFDRALAALTGTSTMRIFAYWGCSDGCYESGLNVFDDGQASGVASWEADMGLNAALAVQALKESADEASALELIDTFELAIEDGWDEDHYPWLLRAWMSASELIAALDARQAMIESPRIRSRLLRMPKSLRAVREDIEEMAGFEGSRLEKVDQLLCVIERLQLSRTAPKARSSKKRAL